MSRTDTIYINYEGPFPLNRSNVPIKNSKLQRIINVWGTARAWDVIDIQNLSIKDVDLGPPTEMFANANFQGVENINIEIIGAFHNDFAYNPNQYADRTGWTQSDFDREFINNQVNLFIRKLYEHVLAEQSTPGDLELFLRRTEGIQYNSVTKHATIDPFKLVLNS